jgi:hypothetical protein
MTTRLALPWWQPRSPSAARALPCAAVVVVGASAWCIDLVTGGFSCGCAASPCHPPPFEAGFIAPRRAPGCAPSTSWGGFFRSVPCTRV